MMVGGWSRCGDAPAFFVSVVEEGKMAKANGKRRRRGALPRIVANKGRRLQRAAPSRRKLFDAAT
jgi:hypothetical protein